MKKDVMILIKGTQEVDGEKDTIELMTKGRYYKRRDVLYLSYEEMDEEDTEPTMRTLLKIEGHNLQPEEMKQVLEAKDRTKAGRTVGPHGLTLVKVDY